MFASAITIQMLIPVTSLWIITLHSIASRVDAIIILATVIYSLRVWSYIGSDDLCLL